MNSLDSLDWSIVAVSIVMCFIPALLMMRKAGRSSADFFASGRAAPWWLIGVSLVATTFSTDTPNFVTNIVRTKGVSSNWMWWAFLLTGMATVFFFARLWRRSGVLTDLEFYELRYSGPAARLVRGFRAVYLGLIFNSFIMGTVNLAAIKISNVMLGLSVWQTILVCAVINIIFAATAGLWGVMVVDMIQFGIAMAGSIAAAWFSLNHPAVGGLKGLVSKLPAETLSFLPDFGNPELVVTLFLIPLTVSWWAVWYPGAEPGGGSYVAQRMLAARSEKDALGGTLFFNVAHYAIRSWPWILVALASLLVFPTLDSIRDALPHVDPKLIEHDLAYSAMLTFLPHGFLGLMVAGLLAAYVSTIVTHLNWGSSYLVHDLWRRFLAPDRTEKHYVTMGRVSTVLLMITGALTALVLDTARQAFDLLLSIGAGTGLLYLLRWYWWRINAWCEIVAMGTSLLVSIGAFIANKQGAGISSERILLSTVAITTLAWVVTALVTKPTDRETLRAFYQKVRPAGPGWRAVREATDLPPSSDSLPLALAAWFVGCLMVYGALFGTGAALYGIWGTATFCGTVFLISSIVLIRLMRILWPAHSEEG